jgi:molybdate/tungstate transport system substrate-binding protein
VIGRRLAAVAAAAVPMFVACGGSEGGDRRPASDGPLVVYTAASITRPLRAVLDSFARRAGVRYAQESGASLELVRRVTELHGEPDVVALADPGLFALLEPRLLDWHALFARNRIVLAYTDRSRGAGEIDATNWWQVLQRPGMQVGRADPNTDPSGYRTLLVWQLAARHYGIRDLEARMQRAAPARNVRPREAAQVALLQAGELDYIWTYESLASLMGLRLVRLPHEIDLGTMADSTVYALAAVRVLGKRAGDTIAIRGGPIVFGVAVPRTALHRALAERFVAYLLSPEGRRILRGERLDPLDPPLLLGTGVPDLLRRAAASAER